MTHTKIPVSRWREKELFEFLKSRRKDLELMEDTYSRWDCISESGKFVAELKCRRKHYPTMLIEKKKYDALIVRAEELGYKPYYINSTPDGVWFWDLSEVSIEWKVEHKHPATTDFGNRTRVAKEVGYLDIKDGKLLKEV